jgi:hypothetical protein
MRRGLERTLDAYRDGALTDAESEKVRRRLARDADARRMLEARDALGALAREAWRDGPPAPLAQDLIAGLRARLADVDAEFDAGPRHSDRAWSWLRPVPLAAAVAGVGALMLLMLWRAPAERPVPGEPGALTRSLAALPDAAPAPPPDLARVATKDPTLQADSAFGLPSAVYSLAVGESPAMLLEAEDGSVVIWLIEEEEELSSVHTADGWA